MAWETVRGRDSIWVRQECYRTVLFFQFVFMLDRTELETVSSVLTVQGSVAVTLSSSVRCALFRTFAWLPVVMTSLPLLR
jgi:hypothetical protein